MASERSRLDDVECFLGPRAAARRDKVQGFAARLNLGADALPTYDTVVEHIQWDGCCSIHTVSDWRDVVRHKIEIPLQSSPAMKANIDAQAYSRHVHDRIADHPIHRIDELLPWAVAGELAKAAATSSQETDKRAA